MLPGNFSLATRFGFGPFYWTPLRLCGYRCVEFWLTQIARMCGEATKLQKSASKWAALATGFA